MQVKTNHQIVGFGTELMGLFDNEGILLVSATRSGGVWTVTAEGADPVTTTDRGEAITALIDTALTILPGTGYSCQVPHTVANLP